MLTHDYYRLEFSFIWNKTQRRDKMIQITFNTSKLPEFFVLTYQMQGKYFVGSTQDIEEEINSGGNYGMFFICFFNLCLFLNLVIVFFYNLKVTTFFLKG